MATTTGATGTRFRVVCVEYTSRELRSLESAHQLLADVDRPGKCMYPHGVEVRVPGGEWTPLHLHQARQILSAPVGTTLDTPDGPLVKFHGGWSVETSRRADAAADLRTDPQAWQAAAGPHEHCTLSADGRGVDVTGFCRCESGQDISSWVRYERWSTAGRRAHGFVCGACRRLTQLG